VIRNFPSGLYAIENASPIPAQTAPSKIDAGSPSGTSTSSSPSALAGLTATIPSISASSATHAHRASLPLTFLAPCLRQRSLAVPIVLGPRGAYPEGGGSRYAGLARAGALW
jgi:hypothetical protein